MHRLIFNPVILAVLASSACGSSSKQVRSELYSAERVSTAAKVSPGKDVKVSQNEIGRILIYNASITLEVDEDRHEQVINDLVEYATTSGGYVSSRTLRSINLKVPSEKFKQSFDYIRRSGDVAYENISVRDITEQYTDTKIRLENAEKLQARLKNLLERASSVEEAVKVESELSRVTERIETLKGRMRLYKNQIAFSEIYVRLNTPVEPGPLGWVFYGLYKGVKWLFVWG